MTPTTDTLALQLLYLKLVFIQEQFETLARQAAEQQWTPLEYLGKLIEGAVQRRQDRALDRRIKAARFPVLKTLESFQWNWPKKLNRMQVQQLFQLRFLDNHSNIIFVGGVDLVA